MGQVDQAQTGATSSQDLQTGISEPRAEADPELLEQPTKGGQGHNAAIADQLEWARSMERSFGQPAAMACTPTSDRSGSS